MLRVASLAEEGPDEGEVPDNSGSELMESALENYSLARDHLIGMEEKVEAYAQQFRFLQLEHDKVRQRLKQLEQLFKQHSCHTSEQLLENTAKAEFKLDQWFQMEGTYALYDTSAAEKLIRSQLAHQLGCALVDPSAGLYSSSILRCSSLDK